MNSVLLCVIFNRLRYLWGPKFAFTYIHTYIYIYMCVCVCVRAREVDRLSFTWAHNLFVIWA